MYKENFSKEYSDIIFKSIYSNFDEEHSIRDNTVDYSIIEKAAKSLYKEEKEYLIKMQKLFKDFVDYVFNNNRKRKLNKLTSKQRFYIYQNTNQDIDDLSKEYVCNYELGFNFHDKNFIDDMMQKIIKGEKNTLTNEDFLINSLLKYDSNGDEIYNATYSFETDNLFTYFYIVLYHIVAENKEFIKKCLVCDRYFFTDKESTLYCNKKISDDMTCKEFGIKTSQKRKENEEPVYGKYRQIYAKKAMAVKRNPDIEYYKTNYEKWKKEAKQFIADIKKEKKTYDEFDEWLDNN